MLVSDKVAVITGGARGIGAIIAEMFAEEGAKGIVIVDIDSDMAKKTAEKISGTNGCKCIAIAANVADEEDVKRVFNDVQETFGILDILVNNAGVCRMASIDDITMDEWDKTMDVNLKGTFLFCREALNLMKKNKCGKIINIASQAAKIGGLMVGPAYPASKAGVLCLTKTFAKEGAPYNINVNSVAPGLIDTEMTKDFGYENQSIPLGRIGTAEDVAGSVLFLASDLSNYITGACIDVNGGMTMW
ncbi:MAG: SDR family NAD(P)-dependent oxidoreductase [Clostridiales bacterium]|nr:SDR family NAD(P)-dependent oxidoreductase [Clostridiales bacterium]